MFFEFFSEAGFEREGAYQIEGVDLAGQLLDLREMLAFGRKSEDGGGWWQAPVADDSFVWRRPFCLADWCDEPSTDCRGGVSWCHGPAWRIRRVAC